MKIALIATEFYPKSGGISHTLTNLCKFLKHSDHTLIVFNEDYCGKNIFNILEKSSYALKDIFIFLKERKLFRFLLYSFWKLLSDKKVAFSDRVLMSLYLVIKPKILLRTIKNSYKIFPYLKRFDVDLIFGGGTGPVTLPLIFLLSRLFNKKVLALSHGNDFLINSVFSFKSIYLKNLDSVILSNKRMVWLIKKIHNIDDNKLTIINRALNFKEIEVKESKQELRKYFNIPQDIFVLLSVGRQIERKKSDLVIRALFLITKQFPSLSFKYFIIGSGPYIQDLKSLVRELRLESKIDFVESCSNNMRNKYYKLSDAFVMPSVSDKNTIEGFGIVFLEANYYRLPVIGTSTGGIFEAIIDGETGLLVKPNDLNDLVEKIVYLYENEDIRNRMGKAGYYRVVDQFSWDIIINDYIRIFQKVKNK